MLSIGALRNKQNWPWFGIPASCLVLLLAFSMAVPIYRSRINVEEARSTTQSLRSYGAGGTSHEVSPISSNASVAEKVLATTSEVTDSATADRKIVRSGSVEAVVKSSAEAAEKIRLIATGLGGYIESAQLSGNAGSSTAAITLRIPASRFDDAKDAIRKLCVRVDTDKTETSDVTRQYVDTEARIRNLRAEEAQYLQIMKSAGKVKDMLDVSEKVSEVRGEIERQQAEFQTLSKQVETATLNIALRTEAVAQVTTQRWRPIYAIKIAANDALDGLANYADVMLAFIFEIPVASLWIATLVLCAAGAWKLLRWVARVFFNFPRPALEAKPAS
jgi:hypothetical protein